jgi:hypothetical protein
VLSAKLIIFRNTTKKNLKMITETTINKGEITTFQTKSRRIETLLQAESTMVPTNGRNVRKIGAIRIIAPLRMTFLPLPTLH